MNILQKSLNPLILLLTFCFLYSVPAYTFSTDAGETAYMLIVRDIKTIKHNLSSHRTIATTLKKQVDRAEKTLPALNELTRLVSQRRKQFDEYYTWHVIPEVIEIKSKKIKLRKKMNAIIELNEERLVHKNKEIKETLVEGQEFLSDYHNTKVLNAKISESDWRHAEIARQTHNLSIGALHRYNPNSYKRNIKAAHARLRRVRSDRNKSKKKFGERSRITDIIEKKREEIARNTRAIADKKAHYASLLESLTEEIARLQHTVKEIYTIFDRLQADIKAGKELIVRNRRSTPHLPPAAPSPITTRRTNTQPALYPIRPQQTRSRAGYSGRSRRIRNPKKIT